jgi:hypothetical protein
VGWAYLIDVLTALGFRQKWQNWVCLSLASATSRVLLNVDLGPPYGKGGDCAKATHYLLCSSSSPLTTSMNPLLGNPGRHP